MNNKQIYIRLVGELEVIARRFLEQRWNDSSDLFQIQIDLLNYQVEVESKAIQFRARNKQIKNLKGQESYKRVEGWEDRVQMFDEESDVNDGLISVYNYVYSISKKLGNSFAYYLTFGNEQLIHALANNTRSFSTPKGRVLDSVKAMGHLFHNAGAGFPILHDVTDLLRIGDITFSHPNHPFITIELKTHQDKDDPKKAIVEAHFVDVAPKGEIATSDATKRFEEITRNLKSSLPHDSQEPSNSSPSKERPFIPLHKSSPRQSERMAKARMWQQAERNKVFDFKGQKGLILDWEPQGKTSHWDVAQNLIQKARISSYAHQVVDDAFVYVAVYDPEPIIFDVDAQNPADWMNGLSQLPTDLISSGIFYEEPSKNSLYVGSSSKAMHDEVSPFLRPIFSYPLPVDDVIDLLWGRLQIFVFINLGRLVEALGDAGVQAELPKSKKQLHDDFLSLRIEKTLSTGQQVFGHLGNMHLYADKIVHEFMSIQAFVDLIKGIADGSMAAIENEVAESKDADDGTFGA